MEKLGNINELMSNMNGYQGSYFVLMDKDPIKLAERYNEIKVAKAIIGAYSIGNNHCLALLIDGRLTIKRSK